MPVCKNDMTLIGLWRGRAGYKEQSAGSTVDMGPADHNSRLNGEVSQTLPVSTIASSLYSRSYFMASMRSIRPHLHQSKGEGLMVAFVKAWN